MKPDEELAESKGLLERACRKYADGAACDFLATRPVFQTSVDFEALYREQAQRPACDAQARAQSQTEPEAPSRSTLELLSESLSGRPPKASAPATSGPSYACSSCASTCGGLSAACSSGSQRSCYQAAACLCRCNLAAGGCGSSIPVLQQCITQNETSAASLVGGTAENPAAAPPQAAPFQQRPQTIDAGPCGRQYGVPCVSHGAQ